MVSALLFERIVGELLTVHDPAMKSVHMGRGGFRHKPSAAAGVNLMWSHVGSAAVAGMIVFYHITKSRLSVPS